ncbi:MAG TPA: sensor histidine kinase [Terriglobia bacterium]|nr:sensor histidine kinase [Terriglobia bacterium]
MSESVPQYEPLRKIPSPSTRLWIGLCIILSIFLVFVVYSSRQIRWLEDFQVNVVQKNRKASLQLLRLQNDSYLLAISLRDLALSRSRYPIRDWESEFTRLRNDMENAAMLEGRFAADTPASHDKRVQLRHALTDFGRTADGVFALAQQNQTARARTLIQTELENKRAVISEIVARLLVLNDQAQSDAADRINATYESVKTDILLITGILFLLALGTGFYTFAANKKTFAKLHHLAEQLQIQSGQLRKLSWKLIDVQEETLRQVARDLHDEFGQILTAIGVMLNRAGRKAHNPDPALLADLEYVKKIVEETLEKVRDQSQMFRPGVLDDFGLDQTLEWFTRQFSRQAGITVHFSGQLAANHFPSEEAIHVYRIVQEALNNAARHSRATEAWVEMEERQGVLCLEIRDNGVGFEVGNPAERSPNEGIGLMGMRERAEHLNGTLDVQSASGKGTIISARIPLKKSPEPHVAEKVG